MHFYLLVILFNTLVRYYDILFYRRVHVVRKESEAVKRMKRWGGLMRKEWALVKWFAIALIVINLGIAVVDNSHISLGSSK